MLETQHICTLQKNVLTFLNITLVEVVAKLLMFKGEMQNDFYMRK